MNHFQKFKNNIEAIRLILQINEEQSINDYYKLKELYTGFGDLPYFTLKIDEILSEKFDTKETKKYYDEIRLLILQLKVKGYQDRNIESLFKSISKSSLTAYYTDKDYVKSIAKNIIDDNIGEINISTNKEPFYILDPSAGTGIFAEEIFNYVNELINQNKIENSIHISFTNLEPENISYSVLLLLENLVKDSPNFSINTKNIKFEEFETNIKYNVITSNIPFGSLKVIDQGLVSSFNLTKRPNIHSYFFLKSSTLLDMKGEIAFITSSGFLDSNANSEYRSKLFHQNFELKNLVRLPKETFKNTEVQTDYIRIKKSNSFKINDNIINNQRITAGRLNISEENNPNKNKEEAYYINDFILNNKEQIYIGELSTNFFFQKYQLSSTLKNQEEIKRKFNQLLISNFSEEFNYKINNIESVAKTELKNQNFQEGFQLDLFAFEEAEILNEGENKEKKINTILLSEAEMSDNFIIYYDNAIINYKDDLYSLKYNNGQYSGELLSKDVQIEQLKNLVNLKNQYLKFNQTIKNNTNDIVDVHQNLINEYNLYVDKFGSINESIKKYLFLDKDLYFKEFKGIEVQNKQGLFVPSDLLSNPDHFRSKELVFDSFDDAIIFNLQTNNGTLDIREVFSSMNVTDTVTKANYIKKALDSGKLFQDISWDDHNNKFVFKITTREDFYSGNINYKLNLYNKLYKKAEKNTFSYVSENTIKGYIDELRAINPAVLNFEEISINISSEWINPIYLENFLRKEFEYYDRGEFFTFTKSFGFAITDKAFKNHYNLSRQLSINKMKSTESGSSILKSIINSESFNFTTEINVDNNKTIKVKDVKANMAAELKRKEILAKWKDYLIDLPEEDKIAILSRYNQVFCSNYPKKFNGDYLSFDNIHHIKDVNKNQRDGIAMILQNDGGIIDHSVGAGKSLIMFDSAMKMKKSGLKNKPVIAALNSTAEQIYNEMKLHYPDANIFYQQPKAYTSNKIKYSVEDSRKEIYAKIANNDWDCVIMTHEEFVKIPVPLDIEEKFMEQYVEELRDNFNFLNQQAEKGMSKGQLKRLEDKLQKEEDKLEIISLKLREKKADTIFDLRTIGFDHFFIDECHKFKKMPFTTIHHDVAGLSLDTSQRARQMELLTLALREIVGEDKGLTQLSGTIIENSIAEIYRTIKWQSPGFLEQNNLNTFDRFAKVFFEKAKESELTVGNAVKEKERFRYIVNVPELKAIYNRIAHIYDLDNLPDGSMKIDRPNVKEELVIVEPNQQQEYFNQLLMEFCEGKISSLKDFERIVEKVYDEDQKTATSLIVSSLSLKNGIDARLINEEYFEPNEEGKLFQAAKRISEMYRKTDQFKGVQLVFSDIGVPQKKDKEKFNIYDELTNILVNRYDIPKEEIQFAQNWKGSPGTPKDKRLRNEFSKKVNEGEFRIVFGSTQTLGTGMNVQKRIVAMHDLDIPWKPSDSIQRKGRGVRQGNIIAKDYMDNTVLQYKYLAKKSLDAFRAQANEIKDKFLKVFKSINNVPRIIDEGDLDGDGNTNNFALMKAYILDNPEMLEVAKLEKKLEVLYQQKEAFKYEEIKINRNINMFESSINKETTDLENYKKVSEIFKKDFTNFDSERFKDKKFQNFNDFNVIVYDQLQDLKGSNYKDIGEAMRRQYINASVIVDTKDFNRLKPYLDPKTFSNNLYKIPLVEMQSFEMYIRVFEMKLDIVIKSKEENSLKFIKRQSVIAKDPVEAFSAIYNELNSRVPYAIDRAESIIKEEKNKLDINLKAKERFIGFQKSDEIAALENKLADLKFSIEIKQKEVKKGQTI